MYEQAASVGHYRDQQINYVTCSYRI